MKRRISVSFLSVLIMLVLVSCGNDDPIGSSPCDQVKPIIAVEQDGFFLTVEITRGAPPFQYSWSNGSDQAYLTDIPSGEYSVVVVDDNGCIAEAEGYYEYPCDNSSLTVRIIADINRLEAVVSGGVPPYELLWNTGDTAVVITDLPEGEYELTVTDSDFCKVQRSSYVGTGCGGLNTAVDASGNVYETVEIGGQCWLAENLQTGRYTSGDSIVHESSPNSWGTPTSGRTMANNPDGNFPPLYGNLYNWYAVNDARGLCPTGWSVPTRAQWEVLMNFAGGPEAAGLELRATEYWNSTDLTLGDPHGFSALPAGYLNVFTGIEGRSTEANFWTAEDRNQGNSAWSIIILDESPQMEKTSLAKNRGLAVRCIKD
ncbi:MAG: fibrobacter succinogenes major paralogous domain-containing protein [Cryomorphaceae bacterium]|nr:fibrobacter succinogenes major paralogous domain-containing protein [Flavobacteriales bacterium]